MITLEEDALQVAAPRSLGWPDIPGGAGTTADSALLATLGSRLHCRTPMKRLDREEPATGGAEGQPDAVRAETGASPEGVATYRCMCGFTMDVPSTGLDWAAAN